MSILLFKKKEDKTYGQYLPKKLEQFFFILLSLFKSIIFLYSFDVKELIFVVEFWTWEQEALCLIPPLTRSVFEQDTLSSQECW